MSEQNTVKQYPKGGGKPKRSKEQREADLIKITELYLRGRDYRHIAGVVSEGKEYTISHVQIANDIREILKRWEKERNQLIDKQKSIEIAKINKLEETYWLAWERSLEVKTKKVSKSTGRFNAETRELLDLPDKIIQEEHEISSIGDPAWLERVEWCIMQRCKILGLEKNPTLDLNIIAPTARSVVFKTRSRNHGDNSGIQEIEEVDEESDDSGVIPNQNLLS